MTTQIEAIKSRLSAVSPGKWTACSMVHFERGDFLSPDEIGTYVANSVRIGVSPQFLFVSVEKPDGPADVCHVGNGPTSPANADFIAHAPEDVAFLLAELDAARAREQAAAESLTDEQTERQMADAEIKVLRAELDAARARERHALVAGAEALRRIAAATPIGHEDVTKGPSTYTWLCYAASLLMDEAATTPATPLEQELITMRAREAKLREALEPFAAYMDAREAKPFLGLGDTIHAIHTGTEWAAELTLAHCKAARAALAEPQ